MSKVGIYARVSTQEQAANGYSIDEQIERATKYAEAMGWIVYNTYVDAGFSGGNMDRPSLKRLIRDASSGRIDKVLVYKLDRLSRSQKDTLYLIEDVFVKNRVEFVSMSESLDTGSPQGKFFLGILASFAQLEREQIKERMYMGKDARAKEGKYCGNQMPPIGYDYDKATGYLVVREEDAAIVRKIYDMYLDGTTVTQIVRELNENGDAHRFGLWNKTSVKNVLKSRAYLGEIKHNGKWIKSKHEPLITEEQHDQAMKRMDKVKADYDCRRRGGSVRSYLGGKLYCAKCGARYAKLTNQSRGVKRCYYACNSRSKRDPLQVKDPNCKNKNWPMEELDELIFDQIRGLVLPEAPTEEVKDDTEAVLTSRIGKIDKQILRLIDLYSLGSVDKDTLDAKINNLNAQKAALERELDEWREAHLVDKPAIKRQITTYKELLELGTPEQRRIVIDALIEKIELDGEEITIYWKF